MSGFEPAAEPRSESSDSKRKLDQRHDRRQHRREQEIVRIQRSSEDGDMRDTSDEDGEEQEETTLSGGPASAPSHRGQASQDETAVVSAGSVNPRPVNSRQTEPDPRPATRGPGWTPKKLADLMLEQSDEEPYLAPEQPAASTLSEDSLSQSSDRGPVRQKEPAVTQQYSNPVGKHHAKRTRSEGHEWMPKVDESANKHSAESEAAEIGLKAQEVARAQQLQVLESINEARQKKSRAPSPEAEEAALRRQEEIESHGKDGPLPHTTSASEQDTPPMWATHGELTRMLKRIEYTANKLSEAHREPAGNFTGTEEIEMSARQLSSVADALREGLQTHQRHGVDCKFGLYVRRRVFYTLSLSIQYTLVDLLIDIRSDDVTQWEDTMRMMQDVERVPLGRRLEMYRDVLVVMTGSYDMDLWELLRLQADNEDQADKRNAYRLAIWLGELFP